MDVFDLFAKISLDTSEYDKGLDKSEKKMSGFSGVISKVGNGIKNGFSLAVKAGAAAIGAATTAVTAFAASAVKAGMDFDSAMSQVGAISGATGEEFDALRDKALEMGSKTKFSATESAEAFNYMAMAGWKTEDMLNGIEGVMNLAAASGEDLATTSDIVTDALTAFGMQASDSSHFADVLAAASSNANTNVAMMGETFKYFAPIAGTFKFNAEDTALAIGLMANSGIKASQAGTSLRGAFSRLAKPTKQVKEALATLGLQTEKGNLLLQDEAGNVRSLSDIMGILREKMSGLNDAQKAQIAAQMFGQEAMSGMLAIVNASEKDYEKLKNAIQDCDGAAGDMAETMQDNLSGDITIFKSALEGARITISDGLTPSLREFVQFGTEGIQTLSDAFKEGGFSGAMEAFGTVLAEGLNQVLEALPKAMDAGMQLLSAFGKGILDNLPTIINAASQVVGQFVQGIVQGLPSLIEGGLKILTGIATGIKEMLPELIPAVTQMLSSIVTTIQENAGTILEAGAAILSSIGQGIIENLSNIMDTVGQLLMWIVQGITENAPTLLDGALQIITGIANGIAEMLPNLIPAVIDMLGSIVTYIGEHAGELLDAGWSIIEGIGQGIANAVDGGNLGEMASGAVDTLLTGIESNADRIQTAGHGMVEFIDKGFHEKLPDLLTKAQEIIPKISETIQTVVPKLIETGKEIISSIVQGLVDNGPQIIETITQTLGEAVDVIFSTGGEFLLAGADIVSQMLDGIVSMLPDIIKGITDLLGKLIDNIIEWLPKFLEKGAEIVSKLIQGIAKKLPDILKSVVDMIGKMLKKLLESLPEFLKTAMKMVGELISGLIKSIPDLIASIPKLIGAIVDTILETDWIQVGCDIIWGLIEGILSMVGNILSAIGDLVGSMVDGFCSLLGISSPSKVFQDYGNMIDQGLSDGIDEGSDKVSDAVDGLGKAVEDPMKSSLDDFGTAGKDFTGKMADGITSMTSDTVGATRNLISEVLQTVQGYFPKFLDHGKDVITNFMHGIKEKVSVTVKAVESLLDKLLSAIEKSFPKFLQKATELVQKMASGIKDGAHFASDAMSEIIDTISDLINGNNWESIGENIVDGIAAGIRANSEAIRSAINSITSAAQDTAEEELDIASPSKLFRYYGRMVDEGFAGGIEDYAYKIEEAVGSFDNVMETPVKNTEITSVENTNMTGQAQNTSGISGGYVQNITINSPTELDPSEIARQTRNATRETILQLRMA